MGGLGLGSLRGPPTMSGAGSVHGGAASVHSVAHTDHSVHSAASAASLHATATIAHSFMNMQARPLTPTCRLDAHPLHASSRSIRPQVNAEQIHWHNPFSGMRAWTVRML